MSDQTERNEVDSVLGSLARVVPTGLRVRAPAVRVTVLLVLATSLLAACRALPASDLDAPSSPDATATHTAPPLQTATPTPPGTWEMVFEGKVYDSTTGEPIEGATVRYEVIFSYYREIQKGRPNTTTTDAEGHYSLPMIVHDTDNIRIHAEAPGYAPYEVDKLDLFGDRTLDITLVPQ